MSTYFNLILQFIAGIIGGNAAGALLKEDYDLGPGNTISGAMGGVIGGQILQALIPALAAGPSLTTEMTWIKSRALSLVICRPVFSTYFPAAL